MRTIRWGIIGTGNIASKFAAALQGMEDTSLAGVASRNLEKASKFAKEFGALKAYGSYEELAEASDIDVVYIGTPHTEHLGNAALIIKNKKAVLCEKPFTLNEKDSRSLVELAKENKVFLMEAMWTKFLPTTNQVKKWINDGKIGTVKKMQIGFGFFNEFNEAHRYFNFNLGGGALLDVGIYPISYAIDLMESIPDKICSMVSKLENGIDEQNCMLFQFPGQAIAMLSSAVSVEVGKDALVIGDKGRIRVPNFWKADKAYLYDNEGKLIETYKEADRINGYEFEAYEVNQCIRDGVLESKRVPLKDTLDVMKIMDDLRKEWGIHYPQEGVSERSFQNK